MMEREMDCRQARDLLLEVVTGTTVPDVRRALARHLEICPTCRREAAALEETARTLREASEPRLIAGHWEAFMAALDRALAADRSRPLARAVRWLRAPRHAWSTAAAAAALIIALALAMVGGPPPAAQPPDPPGPVNNFMTESIVRAQPAMNGSLSVWKAGFGTSDVFDDPPGGE
jgi:anti-sigma factor RsiW